jgi:sigma-B regulation protein RsbU (phosphoserine phosphatase)
MAASVERLLQETKEKERLEQEIRVARNVQESLYPRSLPRLPGTGLAAFCLPARLVSGDLYDVIEISPTRMGLLCADVSGKGIPAAILTATVHAIARALAGKGGAPRPSELVSAMNEELCQRIPDNSFVTVFWADFDSTTRLLRYSNAGHNPPCLIPPGGAEVIRLTTGGVPVGFFQDAVFEESEMTLAPGSLLVLFTDGVPEAQNAAGEEFGEERLLELCRKHADDEPDALVGAVRQALEEWIEGAPQFDDTTVLALKA